MGNLLLIDFGSTFTKVTVVDPDQAMILATAKAHTTATTNIMDGLQDALKQLPTEIGRNFDLKLACSSAAGGLKMVAVGLVKELTAEAARRAALGAGARVLDVFSYELADQDIERINNLKPDIILLAGGTDGGNKEVILTNAQKLVKMTSSVPVVVAGNRVAAAEAAEILRRKHDPVVIAGNVMPELNVLKADEARMTIRELFLTRIVKAKGLDLAEELAGRVLMPTPAAVLKAAQLLAEGYGTEPGLGELVVLDIGGATTDVHSIATGDPSKPGVHLKGLPEPFAKRTVEGDLGMRYSSRALLEAAGNRLKNYPNVNGDKLRSYVEKVASHPEYLPMSTEENDLDNALGRICAELAVERHCGTLEVLYTPFGASYIQQGKDLTQVKNVIGTGGILVHNPKALEILQGVEFDPVKPSLLKPQSPHYFLDREYIMAAMGLLAEVNPLAALSIMKKYIKPLGGDN